MFVTYVARESTRDRCGKRNYVPVAFRYEKDTDSRARVVYSQLQRPLVT